jgi:hypothetical protein
LKDSIGREELNLEEIKPGMILHIEPERAHGLWRIVAFELWVWGSWFYLGFMVARWIG